MPAGPQRWVTDRGRPTLHRAGALGSLGDYAGQDCLAVRNGKGQSALEPCKYFCSKNDVESWRLLIVTLIRDARVGCQRIAKCHRVEVLVNKYESESSAWAQVSGLVTHGQLIEDTLKPVAQELSCIVHAAKKAGKHPLDPHPLPGPPATGPAPEGMGWEMWMLLIAGVVVLGAAGTREYRRRY